MPAKVEALLFDLGGVLLDIDWQRVFQAWSDAARVPASRIAARFAFDEHYEAHERGEIGAPEYCAHLRAALDVTLGDDELMRGWNRIFIGAMPEIEVLLRMLAKSVPLYVFSNTNHAHRAYWQPRYASVLAPFKAVFCSCDLGLRKPAAEAFLEVARRIGAAPERIVFFDDGIENVRGARAAGLVAHEVHRAADIRDVLSDKLG